MFRRLIVFVPACLFLVELALLDVSPVTAADLAADLTPMIEAHPGEVGVCIRHLQTGEQFAWQADTVQPTASLIKLPLMVTAYCLADRGELDLSKLITLTEADKVPGSGILTDHFTPGLTLSVRDTIRLMIRYSDNTATNLVVDQVGLPTTGATMESLGFPHTRLNSKVYRGDTTISPEQSRLHGLGSTTAREMVGLLEQIHKGTVASEVSCKAMAEHLLACDDKAMLVRELPRGTNVAHKSGAVSNSRCDAGIVFGPKGPFVICVLTTENKDRSWNDDNNAQVLIGRIARTAFDHFNPEWAARRCHEWAARRCHGRHAGARHRERKKARIQLKTRSKQKNESSQSRKVASYTGDWSTDVVRLHCLVRRSASAKAGLPLARFG